MRTYCPTCGGLKSVTVDAVSSCSTIAANSPFVTYTSQEFTTTNVGASSSSTENHWCKCLPDGEKLA